MLTVWVLGPHIQINNQLWCFIKHISLVRCRAHCDVIDVTSGNLKLKWFLCFWTGNCVSCRTHDLVVHFKIVEDLLVVELKEGVLNPKSHFEVATTHVFLLKLECGCVYLKCAVNRCYWVKLESFCATVWPTVNLHWHCVGSVPINDLLCFQTRHHFDWKLLWQIRHQHRANLGDRTVDIQQVEIVLCNHLREVLQVSLNDQHYCALTCYLSFTDCWVFNNRDLTVEVAVLNTVFRGAVLFH